MEMNLIETIDKFPDQVSCISFLEHLRWQDKPTCPYCGGKRSSKRPKHRHQCNECNSSYSVLVGTIFEDTKLPLPKWFLAISLILNAKKGLSALQLARDLGVNRKTGWYLQMRIRKAMQEDQDNDLFKGIVEIDETYIGGSMRNHSKKKRDERKENGQQTTGMEHKQPVIGLLERGGRIKLKVIEKANSQNIKPIIAETVSPEAAVVTDGFGAYRGLSKLHKEHHVLNKEKEEYAKGDYHTNTLEGFWTLLKRSIYGQYHKVSVGYLQAYLDEFTFKYNHRTNKSNFALLIQRSLTPV